MREEKQFISGVEGGGNHWKAAMGWWGATVRAGQSSGRAASQDESCPTPNQNPASPKRRYMEEKENTEKKRKTQKQGRIHVSEEIKND